MDEQESRPPRTRGLQGAAKDSRLAQRLYLDVQAKSYRSIEAESGVSRGVLERYFKGHGVGKLELDTYAKIAAYLKLPLWRVLELDGLTVGEPADVEDTAARLARIFSADPALAPLADQLAELTAEQARAVLAYLSVLRGDRQARLNRPLDDR